MARSPRATLDRELGQLQSDVLALGSMVEKAISRSVEALRTRDIDLSRQVINDDDLIDAKRYDIEVRAIDLIATQQPLARDLRHIVAILHIVVELERMGDYAEGIGKIGVMMDAQLPLKPLIDIPRMAELATGMLHRSLDALVARDVALARQVASDDDVVDALYDQVYAELVQFMVRDPETIERATHLLWVAHDLERVADRATNVAEQVAYLVTGDPKAIKGSTY
ncbi:MAG: phosphate signaling complex protein PhoU [Chloroflexi bacterium]|nr:phosphate signaling complex protein PhoU [Chloroflexota bacterium]